MIGREFAGKYFMWIYCDDHVYYLMERREREKGWTTVQWIPWIFSRIHEFMKKEEIHELLCFLLDKINEAEGIIQLPYYTPLREEICGIWEKVKNK
jgi:hypothetical protein